MQTKILMSLSALLMAVVGLTASFLPQEVLKYADAWGDEFEVALLQILGASYLGFAALNWTARNNLIGGVYSRPVALANFMHFGVIATVLVKLMFASQEHIEILVAAAIYCIFALWFVLVLVRPPVKKVVAAEG